VINVKGIVQIFQRKKGDKMINYTDVAILIDAGKTCEDCKHCLITDYISMMGLPCKSWRCQEKHRINDLVPCRDFEAMK